MEAKSFLAETYEQILQNQLPNLFRLYLNPYVVQACFCLHQLAKDAGADDAEPLQTFLANSFDEALSGAIKLARYCASVEGRPSTGLVIDTDHRLNAFATARVGEKEIEFIPGLTFVRGPSDHAKIQQAVGFVVLVSNGPMDVAVNDFLQDKQVLVIKCIQQQGAGREPSAIRADMVVFDESFVRREVPFGAFTARRSLFGHWNTSAKSTFHSTTFQPNTIASLHFLRCLEKDWPDIYASVADELHLIQWDAPLRKKLLRELYSPSLSRAITATQFDTPHVRTDGGFIVADGRRIFDGVSGIACSVRGHNPPSYAADIDALDGADCEAELATKLRALTGLDHMLPAVSGASAVEIALKIGLVAQFPRRHVLAFKSGFGGKTLFALTGTWNASYKEHLDPLYAHVLYVDPFAPDALAQIDSALETHDVAIAQAELIQGVGGVRKIPDAVIRHLAASREKHGYLLLIDEVQSGVYRTGPFTMSRALDLDPDLLVIGKAISDMMFPFALTLYSTEVQAKLNQAGSDLPQYFRARHGYSLGYKTALNVLRFAERSDLARRVADAGAHFERRLRDELAGCKAVREVRVHGLLIGIELDATRWPQAWFKKRLFWFYLAAMLRHARFPVLVGFCQYEPNVLKITPPLTIDRAEIEQVCATIGEVLRRPFHHLLASAFGSVLHSFLPWRSKHGRADQPSDAPVAR